MAEPLFDIPEQYRLTAEDMAIEHVDMEYTPDPGGKSGTLKPANYPKKAMEVVVLHYNRAIRNVGAPHIAEDDVFVVWFSKTIRNWKAMVGSTIAPYYFEVAFDGDPDARHAYIDTYRKVDNSVVALVPKQRSHNEHC